MCSHFSLPPILNIRDDHANSARAERNTPSFHASRGSLHRPRADYSNFYRITTRYTRSVISLVGKSTILSSRNTKIPFNRISRFLFIYLYIYYRIFYFLKTTSGEQKGTIGEISREEVFLMPRERTIFFIRNDAFAVSSPSSLPHLGPLLGSCNDYRAVSVSRFCSKNGFLPFRDHDFASERLKTAIGDTLPSNLSLFFLCA